MNSVYREYPNGTGAINTGSFDTRYNFQNELYPRQQEEFIGGGYDTTQPTNNATPRYEEKHIIEEKIVHQKSIFKPNKMNVSHESLVVDIKQSKSPITLTEDLVRSYVDIIEDQYDNNGYGLNGIDILLQRSFITDLDIDTEQLRKNIVSDKGLINTSAIDNIPDTLNDILTDMFNSIFVPIVGLKSSNFKADFDDIKQALKDPEVNKEASARFKAEVNEFFKGLEIINVVGKTKLYKYAVKCFILFNSENYLSVELEDVTEPVTVDDKSLTFKIYKNINYNCMFIVINADLYKTDGTKVKKVF